MSIKVHKHRLTEKAPALGATGFARLPTVLAIIPVSRSTIFEMIARGEFPRPVKLTSRVSAWRCEDVLAFIDARSGRSNYEGDAGRKSAKWETSHD